MNEHKFMINELKFKINEHKFRINEHNFKINEHKFKINEHKFKINEHKFKLGFVLWSVISYFNIGGEGGYQIIKRDNFVECGILLNRGE